MRNLSVVLAWAVVLAAGAADEYSYIVAGDPSAVNTLTVQQVCPSDPMSDFSSGAVPVPCEALVEIGFWHCLSAGCLTEFFSTPPGFLLFLK